MSRNEEAGIDGIYVVHALKGYEWHEKRLRSIFEDSLDLSFEFVTEGDPSLWTDEVLDRSFTPAAREALSRGVLSCTLNHILACERIVKNHDRYALVFENDPWFMGDFVSQIKRVVAEARTLSPGFMVSLENTTLEFPSWRTVKKDRYLYENSHGRCAGAYLLDQAGARAILRDLGVNKCNAVVDWWHNDLLDRKVLKMYWAHPPLTEQGSHNGQMSSTISSKASGNIRRLRWRLHKFYKMYVRRIFV